MLDKVTSSSPFPVHLEIRWKFGDVGLQIVQEKRGCGVARSDGKRREFKYAQIAAPSGAAGPFRPLQGRGSAWRAIRLFCVSAQCCGFSSRVHLFKISV